MFSTRWVSTLQLAWSIGGLDLLLLLLLLQTWPQRSAEGFLIELGGSQAFGTSLYHHHLIRDTLTSACIYGGALDEAECMAPVSFLNPNDDSEAYGESDGVSSDITDMVYVASCARWSISLSMFLCEGSSDAHPFLQIFC